MSNTYIAYEEQEPSRDMMYILYMKDSLFVVLIYFLQSEFLLYVMESNMAFSFLTLEIY